MLYHHLSVRLQAGVTEIVQLRYLPNTEPGRPELSVLYGELVPSNVVGGNADSSACQIVLVGRACRCFLCFRELVTLFCWQCFLVL